MKKYYFKQLIIIATMALLATGCQKECIEVDVPYTEETQVKEMKKETRKLTYIVNQNLKGRREDGAILFDQLGKFHVYCTITNTDEKGGVFKIDALVTSQGDELRISASEYIGAGETKEIRGYKELNPHSFKANVEIPEWNITAPTATFEKEVTINKPTTKYRKCNTCVEECGKKYKKDKDEVPVWVYVVGGIILLGIIGRLFE